ncbi:unnamed protein product [Pleuronectes platessa]|uniref:Uncharacterized protein n=1 Tax=Pleuronectes platessa TaxID=8262 RepID=A0A9N7VPH1_PLEPL|nr:unnamed protein product [Pleuronectes platessa]
MEEKRGCTARETIATPVCSLLPLPSVPPSSVFSSSSTPSSIHPCPPHFFPGLLCLSGAPSTCSSFIRAAGVHVRGRLVELAESVMVGAPQLSRGSSRSCSSDIFSTSFGIDVSPAALHRCTAPPGGERRRTRKKAGMRAKVGGVGPNWTCGQKYVDTGRGL